jgi:hypothetical protein
MPRFILLLIFAAITGFSLSCEKTFDVNAVVENRPAELVVVGSFTLDRNLQVYVSASRSILTDAPVAYIDNAIVELYRNEEFLTQLSFSEEKDKVSNLPFYSVGDFQPQVGIKYTIKVDAPGFDPVTAHSQIPTPIKLVSSEISNFQFLDTKGEQEALVRYDVNVAFEDPGQVENYYHINFLQQFRAYEITPTDTLYFQEEMRPVVFSNQFNTNYQVAHVGGGLLLEDEGIDGQTIRLNLPVEFLYSPTQKELGKLFIELRAVSKEYYQYFSTISRQNGVSDSPFTDPVIVYDNINGGQGVFAGFSTSNDSLVIGY